ncbi:hypothetical protein F511_13844 [Dorcoceras hygrometricum]|uniref:Uncharacterized protein n=1 Tax=Dorcoceras hygrometricum TaxID=472368 RepID=A0A2Z7DGB8_9LAMI|nr:hypothetical protein F511_13844 [Dorcoceras hygrometricum]
MICGEYQTINRGCVVTDQRIGVACQQRVCGNRSMDQSALPTMSKLGQSHDQQRNLGNLKTQTGNNTQAPEGHRGQTPVRRAAINRIRKETGKFAHDMQGIKDTTESREPKDLNNSSTTRSEQRKDNKFMTTGILSTWELPTHLQYTIPDANNKLHLLLLTHEMWELPTPLIVANKPNRENEVWELPAQPPRYTGTTRSSLNIASWYSQFNRTGMASKIGLDSNMRVCNATADIITQAQKIATMTQILLNGNTAQRPKKRKQQQPGATERNPTLIPTDYTREMSSHTSPSSRKRSKTLPKRSVSARGVQRYHSLPSRSCLLPEIEEDKVRYVHALELLSEREQEKSVAIICEICRSVLVRSGRYCVEICFRVSCVAHEVCPARVALLVSVFSSIVLAFRFHRGVQHHFSDQLSARLFQIPAFSFTVQISSRF